MSEWLKEHAWKACVRVTVPGVRIPLSPIFERGNPEALSFRNFCDFLDCWGADCPQIIPENGTSSPNRIFTNPAPSETPLRHALRRCSRLVCSGHSPRAGHAEGNRALGQPISPSAGSSFLHVQTIPVAACNQLLTHELKSRSPLECRTWPFVSMILRVVRRHAGTHAALGLRLERCPGGQLIGLHSPVLPQLLAFHTRWRNRHPARS